jgi:hypothetical protein
MIRLACIVLAASALGRTASAADFEGRAQYRLTGAMEQQGTAEAVVGPGGARFHVEFTSPKMKQMGMAEVNATTLLKAGDRDHLYSIDEAHHSYAVVDTHPEARSGAWKVTRLGPSSAAGYPCERARIEAGEGSHPAELCIASTLGRVAMWATAAGQGDEGMPAALAKAGLDGLPIRWAENQGADDGSGFVLELVKVTRERVPASEFEVPAGYARRERSSVSSAEMRARMEERLKSLTPEQRKRVEQLLHGKGTGSSP